MANVPLSKDVPKIYVPSLSVPQVKAPQVKAPQIEVPGPSIVRYKKKPKLLAKDLGDIILGDPLMGTKQLQNTLDREGLTTVAAIPILNRIVGAGAMIKQRAVEPALKGNYPELFVNTLETVGSSLDILSNPIKSLLPVAGGGTPEDFLKSMGWVDDEYREMYQWNTGNFVVDLVGEIVSDPINWISFGTKEVVKTGAEQVEDAVRNALKKVLKVDDVPKELVEKYTVILSDYLKSDDAMEEIYKALASRKEELINLLRTTPKSNVADIDNFKYLISQYQNILEENTRAAINQEISNVRMADWYKKYITVSKVAGTAKQLDKDIAIAASILAPAYGLTQLTFKHLISPTFKALWNKYVIRQKDIDINRIINDMPGTIREETNKIITRSKTINKELFASFDEVLAKYNIDTTVLMKDYINLISNTPASKLSIDYLDDEFKKLLFRRMPELKFLYENKETKKEVIKFLGTFKPEDLDEVISKIRETAVVSQAKAKQIKDAQKFYLKNVSGIIGELDKLDVQDRLETLRKGFIVDGVQYDYNTFSKYLKALYKSDKQKYNEIVYMLNYLGINRNNASQIATLLKNNTPDAIEQLKKLLSDTTEAKLLNIKDATQYVKKMQEPILNFKPLNEVPKSIDEIETNNLLSKLDALSKNQVKEIINGTNAIVDKDSLKAFRTEMHSILKDNNIHLKDLDMLPMFTDMDPDIDILNSTFIKDVLNNPYDLNKTKDVKALQNAISELKRKATYWYHQLDNARYSETLEENMKHFLIDLNGLTSGIKTKQLVVDTSKLVRLQDDFYRLQLSKQGTHTAMVQNLLTFFETGNNKEIYTQLSDLSSPLRNNINTAIQALLENGEDEAKQIAYAMQQTLIYIDGFNSTLPLTNKLYTSLDIPKACRDSIHGEVFNYIYKNKDTYIYRLPNAEDMADEIIKNYTRNNEERLLKHFAEHTAQTIQDINYIDELNELEKKLQLGTLDSTGMLRYEELKEVLSDVRAPKEPWQLYQEHLDELHTTITDALDEYVQRLNLYSMINDYEFRFYTMFSDEATNYMNDLGRSLTDTLEYLSKSQADILVMTDVQEFITMVAGVQLHESRKQLINNLYKGAHSSYLKEDLSKMLVKNENSLAFAITDTFKQIDKINQQLADQVGNLGYDMNGNKLKNILNYYAVDDFNVALKQVGDYKNSYDWSTQNGILGTKKLIEQDVVDKLALHPNLVRAVDNEYTQLYHNLSIAYNRVERLGVYKPEAVANMRSYLAKLFTDNNITWGPVNPTFYFMEADDKQILAWDCMLRTNCFGKGPARKYRMLRQLDYLNDYNAKADYYSNPWNVYKNIDEITEEVFSDDNAYDKVIDLIDADNVVSDAFFDELYRGVTADLQQVVHDPQSLLDYRFLFQTQIQEQVKSINNLRSLDKLRLNYRKVGDVIKDKEALKLLKSYHIYPDTLLGHDAVQKFLYNERKQLLSNNLQTFNAKQLRTWVDKNTAGIAFWVVDDANPLPVFTPKDLEEAGLIIKPLKHTDNIFIIRRTNNLMTDTPYTYKLSESYFKNEQKTITDIFKANRHDFYWDGMDVPDEIFTGNMVSKNTYDTIMKDPYVQDIVGTEAEQKVYSKFDSKGLNNFYTTEVSRPSFIFLGATNAEQQVLDATAPTFIIEGVTPVYSSTNLIKSTWSGNLAAVKRENKVNKYLQLWLNEDYSLGNPTFRPILENATDDELKELFSKNRYAAVIVKQDNKGRPRVYRIFIDNHKQLQDAFKEKAIMVPQEIYRNMILAVNKHQMDNNLKRVYKNIVAATYKSLWLRTPGFLMRNALDSLIQKNAATTEGMSAIIDNFKYEYKANRLIEWHNKIQYNILHMHAGDELLADGTFKPEILDKAIESYNRKAIRYGLKYTTKEEARATYYLVDMFLQSSASGGLSKALNDYLLDYSIRNGKFNGTAFEKWYGEHILGDKFPGSIYLKPFQDINDTIEQSARFGLFLKLVDEGGDYTEAIRKVVGTHFDYAMREAGISWLDNVFWFSTFPINNFLYYINGGILDNPDMLKLQMDAMQLSWNDDEISWDDVKKSKYLQSYAFAGHIRFKWIDGHHVVLKTGSSVLDFLGMLINPIEAAQDHLNPFLSVLLGTEAPSELNPLMGDIRRLGQIKKRLNSPLGSYVPSVYTKFDMYKPKEYHRIEWAPYVRSGKGSVKPKKSYFKKPDNMKRMRYQFTTYRYYFNRGKNLHRWLTSTNSIEPYWYMNKRRWMRTGRKPRFMKQVVHIK